MKDAARISVEHLDSKLLCDRDWLRDPRCVPFKSFESTDEPNQWVRWDFRETRVRLTGYAIRSHGLRSWVIEGSSDGSQWLEIDRQTDNQDFKIGSSVASFHLSKPAELRFVRLTQTEKTHPRALQGIVGVDRLFLHFVEFFGSFFE
jgi:hypothetical protein